MTKRIRTITAWAINSGTPRVSGDIFVGSQIFQVLFSMLGTQGEPQELHGFVGGPLATLLASMGQVRVVIEIVRH